MVFNARQLSELAIEIELEIHQIGRKISTFEAFQLAVQMQRNDIIARAFGIGNGEHNINFPAFLEKIAMELEKIET